MKKLTRITMMLAVTVCAVTAMAKQRPVKPAVFALDPRTLERNKARVNAKEVAIMPAYKQLMKDAESSLQFGPVSVMEKKNVPPSGDKHDYMSLAPYFWPDPSKPDGLPYIRKDGQTNPEVKDYKDKEYMPKMCEMVYTLALGYYFSGDGRYADHASKLLRVWFLDTATRMNPNLKFGQAIKGVNTGRGTGLIDTRHFIKVIDAIGLLQGAKSWTAQDQEGMTKWFSEFLDWMQTSKYGKDEMKAGNNHGDWYDAQRLSMALFIGDHELARGIVESAAGRLDQQMDDNSFFPREMERTISLHYTVFALEAFFNIANMAEKTGADFWNLTTPSGKSLKKAMAVLYPYLIGDKKWEGPQIKAFDADEAYPLLAQGERFGCKNCREGIRTLAGEKASRLREQLLY